MRLEIKDADDRTTVAAILFANGYIVRQGRERSEGKKTYTYYVEAIKEGKENKYGTDMG